MPLFPIRAIALMRRGNCRQSDTRYRQTPYSESTTIPTLILIAPCNPHDGLQQYNKHQVQACHIILGIENLANFGVKDKANASKNKKPTAVSITKIVHDKHILKQRLLFSLFLRPYPGLFSHSPAIHYLCGQYSMSALYIHIPFCRTRCIYCDFHSGTDMSLQERYIEALCTEAALRADELPAPVETLYLGGGTPSQLSPALLHKLFTGLSRHIETAHCIETTIECNPDDLTPLYIEALTKLPINRISMGIQSFDDGELHFLRRRHTAQAAIDAVERCRKAGFDNISIDLMYSLPGQTLEGWQHNIERAIGLGIQHISAYALSYEEGTTLHRLRQTGAVKECDEELSIAMYETLIERLQAAAFEQYEISNFALPGYYSRHNSSYWQNIPYLGLGAAAHSYDGSCRRQNPHYTLQYIQSMEECRCCYKEERLTTDDRFNDMLLTRLRTRRGIDCTKVASTFGPALAGYLVRQAAPYLRQGSMEYDAPYLRIARHSIFISDSIIADLFHIEEEA